jgi:hypothetical protein
MLRLETHPRFGALSRSLVEENAKPLAQGRQ